MPTAGEMRQIKAALEEERRRRLEVERELRDFKKACEWYESEIKRLNEELGRAV